MMFAGGGTGGHIYPLIAVAEKIKRKLPDTEVLFIGGTKSREQKIVENSGFPVKTIPVTAMPRNISPKIPGFTMKLGVSILKSRSYIRKFKPAVVMATGGYISGPPMMAALSMGVPLVILEQNTYPGITNRKLGRYADIVFLGFRGAEKNFSGKIKSTVTGNPVRSEIGKAQRDESARAFGFNPSLKTVLAFGGSQGARAINKALSGSVESIANKGIQVIWQTGDREYKQWSSYDGRSEGRIKVCKYIDNIAQAYATADLVVARAGAMSISEITLCGLPAVFIPLATAAANHQEYNARMIVDAGAASVIFARELTSSLLAREIIRIVTSDERLAAMSKASSKIGKKNAATVIAGAIMARYGVN